MAIFEAGKIHVKHGPSLLVSFLQPLNNTPPRLDKGAVELNELLRFFAEDGWRMIKRKLTTKDGLEKNGLMKSLLY